MSKESRMSLKDLRKFLRNQGYSASHTVYKGIYTTIPEAVHIWGNNCEEAAKLVEGMGYNVEKDKQFKRYEVTY